MAYVTDICNMTTTDDIYPFDLYLSKNVMWGQTWKIQEEKQTFLQNQSWWTYYCGPDNY